jgi:hypothetical protein
VSAKAPPAAGGRVTTLEPGAASGWQSNDDTQSPFTSVGIVQGGGAPTQFVDPSQIDPGALGAPIVGAAPVAQAQAAAARPGAPGVASRPAGKTVLERLPEPGTWVLLLVGLAMIGFALRGLVAANRRLARLETPEA